MTTLWSSAELAAKEFPEPAYLVEPMIPQGGLFILHGKPGIGKTQFIMTLAHAVNHGYPLFGRWPTRQGKVIIVQADMTGQIQQDRLVKVLQNVEMPDTYWVVEEDGSTPLINITTMTLMKSELVDLMREVNPILTFWDTLRKIHQLPENVSETPIAVFNAARSILPLSTHGFAHHNRKESRDPDAAEDTDEAFMGNQQWKGAVDATLSLKEISTPPKRMQVVFHKARTAPDTERIPFCVEMDMQDMLLRPTRGAGDGRMVTGAAARNEARRLGTL